MKKNMIHDRFRLDISSRTGRQGASVVELAVTLPLMMILLLGAIDAGQAVDVWNKVDNASRVGARTAARNSTTSSTNVTTAVTSFLQGAFPSVSSSQLASGLTVTVRNADGTAVTNLSSVATGEPISVEVELDYDTVRWTQEIGLLPNRTFGTTTQMRKE